MKPIQEVYEQNDWGSIAAYDYDPMVECFGDIVVTVSDRDYQGDTRYLLRSGDRWGILVNGWGSCSGCDALQACNSYEDLEKLRAGLGESIEWFDTASACAERLRQKDWEAHHSWRERETREFIEKALTALDSGSGAGGAE